VRTREGKWKSEPEEDVMKYKKGGTRGELVGKKRE
jgi:hypothetical protein